MQLLIKLLTYISFKASIFKSFLVIFLPSQIVSNTTSMNLLQGRKTPCNMNSHANRQYESEFPTITQLRNSFSLLYFLHKDKQIGTSSFSFLMDPKGLLSLFFICQNSTLFLYSISSSTKEKA